MDFTKGYKAAFYAVFLDAVTWSEQERFDIVSGSVSRTNNGLRSTAELVVREYDQPIDRWIRIYMDADQEGDRAHVPLFTGIVSTPGSDHNGALTSIHLSAYSPLKAAEDIKLQLGWYAPAGASGVRVIQKLLKNQPAPVVVNGTGRMLSESIIAEQNDNCASMTDEILSAMNWKMQISGDGTIILSEKESEPEPVEILSADNNDVIETSFSKSRDWFACPNVLIASTGSQTAEARDDNPNSELSTVSRGREVQVMEENVQLSESENISQYAERRLRELQVRTETASYQRRFLPDVNVEDSVRIAYRNLSGVYEVESQTTELGVAGRTQEGVKRVI